MNAQLQFQMRIGLVIAATLLMARVAHALIFASTGSASFNTTPPGGVLTNSGWQWQGSWGGFLGTPIGPHHFITAAHVGGSTNQLFRLNGVDYQPCAMFDDPETDLRIWQVKETFPSYAPLYRSSNELGRTLMVFGKGGGRGTAVNVTNATTVRVQGWRWGPNDGLLRWGANVVTRIRTGNAGVGSLLSASFDAGAGANEAHMAGGDSGGAVFIAENGTWKLAGINFAVDGSFNHTNSGAGFDAALFDIGGLFVGSPGSWSFVANQTADIPSSFHATRISQRIEWIDCVLANAGGASPPLRVNSAQRMGTDVVVEFTTLAGCHYQLQRNDRLEAGSWIDRGGAITGTGAIMAVIDAEGGDAASRFYRIRLLE